MIMSVHCPPSEHLIEQDLGKYMSSSFKKQPNNFAMFIIKMFHKCYLIEDQYREMLLYWMCPWLHHNDLGSRIDQH